MTSLATELATPSVTDVRYLRTDTLPSLIYKHDAIFIETTKLAAEATSRGEVCNVTIKVKFVRTESFFVRRFSTERQF